MRFSARSAEHSQRGTEVMSNRKIRLVLECAKLIVEIARLTIVLLNMAFNYPARLFHRYARKVVEQV